MGNNESQPDHQLGTYIDELKLNNQATHSSDNQQRHFELFNTDNSGTRSARQSHIDYKQNKKTLLQNGELHRLNLE